MRTTLNLDDDILQMVRGYATSRFLTLSEAVCEVVREGLRPADAHAHGEWNPSD